MSDSSIIILSSIFALMFCIIVGLSVSRDVEYAKAGLQQCYVSDNRAAVWMKECPK